MDSAGYTFNGKLWKPSATTTDCNSFFHSTFGTRNNSEDKYFDKHATVKRMLWATFLTYFQNETKPNHLEDLLRTCLLAREKYTTASTEDEGSLQSYIEDIIKAEENVTVEEIPILATLNNTEVAVLTNEGPDTIMVAKPDARILGNYPIVLKPKHSMVLLLEENTFSRLEAVEDLAPELNVEAKENSSFHNFGTYKKLGNAGSEGVDYQVDLLIVVLLNALEKLNYWRLSTENDFAGKLDDIVLEDRDGAVLIQAKHKSGRKTRVTTDDLLSTNTKNVDYSLPKYFLSYLIIKKKFQVKKVIVCTNIDVHEGALSFLAGPLTCPESMLYYEHYKSGFYILEDEILPDLKEKSITYYRENFQNKGIDEAEVTEENLKDFQKDFQIHFNYPPRDCMDTVIQNLLDHTVCIKVYTQEIRDKVKAWFKQKCGVYLNETSSKGMLAEIWTDKYLQGLDEHKVFFEQNTLNYENSKKVTHLVAEGGYLLQILKVYQALHHLKTDMLCFDSQAGTEFLKLCIEGFNTPRYKALLIVWRKDAEETGMDVFNKLRDILSNHRHKKVFLVAGCDNNLLQQITFANDAHHVVEELVTLADLSNDTIKSILKKEIVIFQGRTVSLEQLFTRQIPYQAVRSELLEKLILSETVKVGSEVQTLSKQNVPYYIDRTLYRHIDNKAEEGVNSRRMKEIVTEDKVFEVNEKFILIADDAGAGKSTLLAHLAYEINNKHPHFWVITIELNACSEYLKFYKEKGQVSLEVGELINIAKLNELEKVVFSFPGRVVLFVDGVDEISPDYTELIVDFLGQCKVARNIAKLFVSSRPFMTQLLEDKFGVESFKLEPLNEKNQIHFLTQYWINNLKLDDNNTTKCEQYAASLLMLTSSWIRLDNNKDHHLAAVPLQVTMLAEVFQENSALEGSSDWQGCKEYLNRNDPVPQFPKRMDVVKIYEMFIERKRKIFHVKSNPSGYTSSNMALDKQFQECLAYHETLALKVILGDSDCLLFSRCQQDDKDMDAIILKIGIVQKSDNRFYFIHRTFAEYFVAKSVFVEVQLQTQKPSTEFQKFFFDKILLEPKFKVIRTFFSSFLSECADDLLLNIFQNYKLLTYDVDMNASSNLIHQLASEGCVAVLQLLFRCIGYEGNNDRGINVIHLTSKNFAKCANVLQVLQIIVQENGVNIKNEFEATPLHLAVRNGHLEMVKFLVRHGANINTSWNDEAPLHFAVASRYFEIVKFLVQQGADCKKRYKNGDGVMYKAICVNHVDMVKCLLEHVLKDKELKTENSILPFTFAYLGWLEELQNSLDGGLDVNNVVENDESLIFGAARGGQTDIIRYLIEKGADVNSQDGDGNTALHLVSRMSSRFSTAELLVKLGIDINVKNFSGDTPLFCGIGNIELVEFFVKSGANIDSVNERGSSPLSYAASIGRLEVVKYLVNQECDVHIKDNSGKSVLQTAAERGTLDVLIFFLSIGMDINERDDLGGTLIHSALYSSHDSDTVRYLVNSGVDINVKNANGNTALHVAVSKRLFDMVEYIVQSGADVNSTDKDSYTALHLAVRHNYLDIVQLLIELGADDTFKDKKDHTALQISALFEHWNIYNYLLRREEIVETEVRGKITILLNPFLYYQTMLHFAAALNRIDTVKFLVNLGVDINIRDDLGGTPLHFACFGGQLDTVKYLVQLGADLNIKDNKGETPLYSAIFRYPDYKTSRDIIRYLIRLGADINIRNNCGRTILHSAISKGDCYLADFFKQRGLDVYLKDDDDNTALHHAASSENTNIISLLIRYRLDINAKNNEGHTALHLAVMQGRLNIVELLKSRGSDITTTNNNGRTVLHTAVTLTNPILDVILDVINYLLNSGIDVDVRDNNGSSPLHLAVLAGKLDVVQYLVHNHASVNIQDNDGRTALHLAASEGNLNMVKYLVSLCHDINARDNKGNTVLHLVASENSAAKYKDLQEQRFWRKISRNVAKFLVEQGADVNTVDLNGNTAASLAEEKDNFHLFKILKPSNFENR